MLCMIKGGTIKIVEVEVLPENLEMMPLRAMILDHGGTSGIIPLTFGIPKGGLIYLWDLEKSSPSHLDNPFIQVIKGMLTFVVFISGLTIIPAGVEN